jgi:adenosylhomocysteine nucleosidase
LKVVVIISADGEWSALKTLLGAAVIETTRFGEKLDRSIEGRPLTFFHGGWGKVSAAASTQFVIDQFRPDLIVNLGTCGGFRGRIERGTIVLVHRTLIYDIVELMGSAEQAIQHYSTSLDLSWLSEPPPSPVHRGLLVSGDRDVIAESIPKLISNYDAVAADWESGAIAWVAGRNGQRLLILRGVTDLVGEEGGEAYGNYQLFLHRARDVMGTLIAILPVWLNAFEGALGERASQTSGKAL